MSELSKEAYQKLIFEDINWIMSQPDSLEARHVITVLQNSLTTEYPNNDTEAEHKKAMQEQRKEIWRKIVESKQHMKVNHIDYIVLRGIILGDSDE